jgi:hypothetical protein
LSQLVKELEMLADGVPCTNAIDPTQTQLHAYLLSSMFDLQGQLLLLLLLVVVVVVVVVVVCKGEGEGEVKLVAHLHLQASERTP